MAHILLVEDDPGLRRATRIYLAKAGHQVSEAGTAEEGLAFLQQESVDLVVSDIQMPGISGFKLLDILRSEPRTAHIPVILLTVMDKSPDKVRGLHGGADDYITKPYDPPELVARVDVVLRRPRAPEPTGILEFKELRVDTVRREVLLKGKQLVLRKKEYELLVFFLRNRGKLLTKDRIARALWGEEAVVSEGTLPVHLKSLRDKLGAYGSHIETLINEGYRYND